LVSTQLANDLTENELAERWQKFEISYGPIQNWGPTNGRRAKHWTRVRVSAVRRFLLVGERNQRSSVFFTRLNPKRRLAIGTVERIMVPLQRPRAPK
jgi:hypothetical protein